MDTAWLLAQIFTALLAIVLIFNLTRHILAKVVNRQSYFTASGRPLGRYEALLELLRIERKGTTNSCYVMTLHSKEKLKESFVREALVRVAKRQPLLRAVVKTVSTFSWFGQNDTKYFDIIKASKVGDMIDLITSDLQATEWQKEWYVIGTRPRDETGLLWQAVLFKGEYLADSENYLNTIVFRVNHCIIDGKSGMKLCGQFLSQLNHVSQHPQPRSEDVPSLELQPSLYDILINTRPWSLGRYLQEIFGLQCIIKLIVKVMLSISLARKPVKPYDFFVIDNPSEKGSNFLYKVFSESETSQICKVCKRNGTTVTGALVAATQIAYCKILESQSLSSAPKLAKQRELMVSLPISALRLCQPQLPDEYLGNYFLTKVFPLSYESDRDNFWSLAQEATTIMHTELKEENYVDDFLERHRLFTTTELLDEFVSPQDPEKKMKVFVDNFISNAGLFSFHEDDNTSFKLRECAFYTIPFEVPRFSYNHIATVNGRMAWAIVSSGFFPSDVQKQFAKYCFDAFQSVADGKQA